MRESYTELELEIIDFGCDDVIVTSEKGEFEPIVCPNKN